MSPMPAETLSYLQFAGPPVIGAFIGYFTNKVAIKMLFRPLEKKRLLGIPIPMTPGVIPSKRHQLADNMGEVVGDHLLTSKEIGKALQEPKFQKHLEQMIMGRGRVIMQRALPSLPELLPEKFRMYFDTWARVVIHQVSQEVINYLHSDTFETLLTAAIENKADSFLGAEFDEIAPLDERQKIYTFIENQMAKMLASPVMAQWLDDYIYLQLYTIVEENKSINDIVPESLLQFLEENIEKQTPLFLEKLAGILSDPEVRERIVQGACQGVEKFIDSLGPMAGMVHGFINMEMVDEKVREYLEEKEGDITAWLSSSTMQEKTIAILRERFRSFCSKPISELLKSDSGETLRKLSSQFSSQVHQLFANPEFAKAITAMVQENIETHLESGGLTCGQLLNQVVGQDLVAKGKGKLATEAIKLLRSEQTTILLRAMVAKLIDDLSRKPIGKLSNFLPPDIQKTIYSSIRSIVSAMLEREVPGLVRNLDIKRIVADKLNSLDLLRLEGLLLSIMEEQFKYINLFGALLGFLIGCINLLLLNI